MERNLLNNLKNLYSSICLYLRDWIIFKIVSYFHEKDMTERLLQAESDEQDRKAKERLEIMEELNKPVKEDRERESATPSTKEV